MFSNSEFFNSCENLTNLYIFPVCCHVQISDTHSHCSALSIISWAQTKGNKNHASNQPKEKGKLPSSCGYVHSHWETVYSLVHHSSDGVLSFREFMTIIFLNFILLFKFTILYWFCHISTWIHHRYTHVSHLEPSSLLPPHTIPLGRPSVPAPSIQYRASNLDWRLVSYDIIRVSMPFSRIIPPSPSPTESKRLFYTSVTL